MLVNQFILGLKRKISPANLVSTNMPKQDGETTYGCSRIDLPLNYNSEKHLYFLFFKSDVGGDVPSC
jgi:hypothetical protein